MIIYYMGSIHLLAASILVLVSDARVVDAVLPGEQVCLYGSVGLCGLYNRYSCPAGSTCYATFAKPTTCCRNKQQRVACPASSGLGVGICEFDPKSNCWSDTECPANYMCCPEGCRKVCKHMKTGQIYPGYLPGRTMSESSVIVGTVVDVI